MINPEEFKDKIPLIRPN